MESVVDNYAKDVLSLLCGDYTDDSDKCERIVAITPDWDNSKKLKWNSLILSLAEVLDSIKD